MVIKVRLIRPKKRQSNSFYKTSEIKFQSLSIPSQMNLTRFSTQKIIKYTSPWEQLNSHQINILAERLEDKPSDLYQLVKQKQNLRKQQFKSKFNKITFKDLNISKLKSTLSLGKKSQNSTLSSTNFSKRQNLLRQLDLRSENKMAEIKLLKRIQQKRNEYEKELKKMFKDKRLILQTDLPKINKIKVPQQTFFPFVSNSCEKSHLPIWKVR